MKMEQANNELNYSSKKNEPNKNGKATFFILFKLITSIIYFVPAFFVFAFGFSMNLIFTIFAAGGSKNGDVSNLIQAMPYIGVISIIPAILCIVFFVISIISTAKYFKNKYSKKLDMFMTILFLILDLLLFVFSIKILSIKLIITLSGISVAVMIVNIIEIIKYKNN